MTVPVVATDGHSYELDAISDVFRVGNGLSSLGLGFRLGLGLGLAEH